jgi:Ser/Thr protein kinase RdoA (MazF antagonist)
MERASSWSAVSVGLEEVLGEPVELGEPLGRSRTKACVRAAASAQHGQLVVKLRHGDRADEKTSWLATHLPRLAERGYPAPRILWHGPISVHWYAVVEERLPGTPVHSLADEQLLALLDLVELQADAAIAPGPRDFGSYVSNVLFDDWDGVWHDANSTRRTAALCADLTNLLRPIRGHPIVGLDFAHNDLNLSNVLSDGRTVTGIVDWDEFGLNNRAADLTALAFDCIKLDQAGARVPLGAAAIALDRARGAADEATIRCLIAYRILGHLAARIRRGERAKLDSSIDAAGHLLALIT